jgi:F-type H+-transporting ATPase subunit alpha
MIVERTYQLPTITIYNAFLKNFNYKNNDYYVYDGPFGKILDPFGRFLDKYKLDGSNFDYVKISIPIENKGAEIINRTLIRENLPTGIKIVDSMVPIGRGQRELIIGDKKTGKTTLALDIILNQKNENTNALSIYVAIGQKHASVIRIMNSLRKNNCLKYVIIIFAGASDASSLQYLAPYAGCSLAE